MSDLPRPALFVDYDQTGRKGDLSFPALSEQDAASEVTSDATIPVKEEDDPELQTLDVQAEKAQERENDVHAVELLTAALEKRVQRRGQDDESTIQCKAKLATACVAAGMQDDATRLRKDVLAQRRRLVGDDDLRTLDAEFQLANGYVGRDMYDEALAIEVPLLAKRRRIQGSNHADTLRAMSNLSVTLQRLERFDESLPLAEENVERYRRTRGDENPDTIIAMLNLAGSYTLLSQHADALPYRHAVFVHRRKEDGAEASGTLRAAQDLGTSHLLLQNFDEVLALGRDVVAARERQGDAVMTLDAQNWLGAAQLGAQDYEGGIVTLKKVYAGRSATLGRDDSCTVDAHSNLALAYQAARRFDEAEVAYADVLARRRRALGNDHGDAAAVQFAWASVRFEQGNHLQGLNEMQSAYARLERVHGANSPMMQHYKGFYDKYKAQAATGEGANEDDKKAKKQHEASSSKAEKANVNKGSQVSPNLPSQSQDPHAKGEKKSGFLGKLGFRKKK